MTSNIFVFYAVKLCSCFGEEVSRYKYNEGQKLFGFYRIFASKFQTFSFDLSGFINLFFNSLGIVFLYRISHFQRLKNNLTIGWQAVS